LLSSKLSKQRVKRFWGKHIW